MKNPLNLLVVVLALICSACSFFSPSTEDLGPGPKEFFWGRWVRMDGSNEEWYMASDGILVGYATNKEAVVLATATSFSYDNSIIEKQTDNIVKVTPSNGDLSFYLFRKSGTNAKATLNINASSTSKGPSGLGGIGVVITNPNNPGNTITPPPSNGGGSVTVPGLILGDSYIVTIPVQPGVTRPITAPLNPVFDGQNLGSVTVGTQANFKVSAKVYGDPEYLVAGKDYELTLNVRNIGSANMLSANYSITQPAGLAITGSLQDILGSMQADGGEKSIKLTINAQNSTNEYEQVFEIPITITSTIDGTVWNDTVSLRFFKNEMTIYIKSASAEVQGVIISPEKTSIPFKVYYRSGSISVPVYPTPYTLALSGSNYNSETKYAVSTHSQPLSNGSEITNASINEPNNSEIQTTILPYGQTQLGFLGVYDLDFYSVYPLGSLLVNLPTISGVTAPVKGATPVTTITETEQYTGTVTWTPSVPTTFWHGTTYTATITLTAKPTFTIIGVPSNFFSIAGATSSTNALDSGVITAVFPTTIVNLAAVSDYTGTGVGTLKAVQGGTFNNGSANMTVSSFRMSQYEVTGDQYAAVMSVSDPSNFVNVTNNPVEMVTWYDAVEFCNKLSKNESLTPVYIISSRTPSTGYPITSATVNVDWSSNGYRLPTEAEWQFAAQGGNSTHNYTYAGSNTIGDVAWYTSNSGNTTHTVGGKVVNELGLYDMSGNVFEWCWDWYGTYPTTAQIDYRGTALGTQRVYRGGGWGISASYCLVAIRLTTFPDFKGSSFGFRVVRP